MLEKLVWQYSLTYIDLIDDLLTAFVLTVHGFRFCPGFVLDLT